LLLQGNAGIRCTAGIGKSAPQAWKRPPNAFKERGRCSAAPFVSPTVYVYGSGAAGPQTARLWNQPPKFRFGRSVRIPGDTLKTFSIQTYNGLSWFRWRPLLRWKTKPRRALKPAPGPLLDLQSIPWDCPTSVTLYSEKQFRLSWAAASFKENRPRPSRELARA